MRCWPWVRGRVARTERTAREIGLLPNDSIEVAAATPTAIPEAAFDPAPRLPHRGRTLRRPHACRPPRSHLFAGKGPLVVDDPLDWPAGSVWQCGCGKTWSVVDEGWYGNKWVVAA